MCFNNVRFQFTKQAFRAGEPVGKVFTIIANRFNRSQLVVLDVFLFVLGRSSKTQLLSVVTQKDLTMICRLYNDIILYNFYFILLHGLICVGGFCDL